MSAAQAALTAFEAETPREAEFEGLADREVIQRYLRRYARGRDDAVHADTIATYTECKDTTVRDKVRRLRRDAGRPIAKCGDGYFWCATQAELNDLIQSLESEIETRRNTVQQLKTVEVNG